jgi:hypothetical protein
MKADRDLYEQRCHRLSKLTVRWLQERAQEMGISEADLVRRVLDEYRLQQQQQHVRRDTGAKK